MLEVFKVTGKARFTLLDLVQEFVANFFFLLSLVLVILV